MNNTQKLKKIGDSKQFHEQWESLNKKLGAMLSEAYNPEATTLDWADACNETRLAIDKLISLGYDIRDGIIKE